MATALPAADARAADARAADAPAADAPAEGDGLTHQDMLDYAGEDDLAQVRELVLRAQGITEVGALFEPLQALEVLSLSNNLVHSLAGCASMSRLTTLNVNFNRVTSLEPLSHCPLLEQLFASSNKISSVAPLGACARLRGLSLFRNQVASLDGTLAVLERLPALRELDLGANPCALGPPYRHRIVSALQLESLDGDALTELDAQLAADFGAAGAAAPPPVVLAPADEARPATAAAAASPSRRPTTAPPRSKDLFRDPFLNSNAILLDYLSQAELEHAAANPAPGGGTGAPAAPEEGAAAVAAAESVMSLRRPMVERLRMTAAAMDGVASSTPQQLAGAALFRPHEAQFEQSKEQHTIKNLLRLVQELTAERDEAREKLAAAQLAGGGGGGGGGAAHEVEALQAQVAALQHENRNMYALIDQNRALAAQLDALRAAARPAGEVGAEPEST